MAKMHIAALKNSTSLCVALLALTAPLFSLRIIASVTLFDIVTLIAILFLFSSLLSFKTTLSLSLFLLVALISEWHGLFTLVEDGAYFIDSVNILFRYLILLFVMPFLSYRLFYSDPKGRENIEIFYYVLMCSFFGVLIFNVYAIYYQLEDYFFLQRFISIYGNANTAALVLNIMSVLYLFNTTHKSFFIRILSYSSIPLTIFALVLTGSFSGYLIQFIILSVFLFKAANIKVTALVVLASIVLFSLDLTNLDENSQLYRGLFRLSGLVTMVSSGDGIDVNQVGSYGERMASIEMSLEELIMNPRYLLTGVGFGNVEVLVLNRIGFRTSIHVSYLQLLVSIGAIGALIYFYVFVRIFRKIPRYLMGNKLITQSFGLLLAFLFLGMFIPHTYMSFYYAPIFPLLGLYGMKSEYR